MRRSSRLAVPLRRPEDVIPHLCKPTHWKQGRSAKALADSWFLAADIPASVRRVLDTVEHWHGAEMLDGWLERETDLGDGRGSPSQTDLLALVGLQRSLAVLGIEAKVDESFGPLVSEWLSDGSAGKLQRLRGLCELLRLDIRASMTLRYQLLHRTVAVIREAQRFRTGVAALVVHSFCPSATGLADCRAFLEAVGIPGLEVGTMVGARRFGGVDLWVGWAGDQPLAERASADARQTEHL